MNHKLLFLYLYALCFVLLGLTVLHGCTNDTRENENITNLEFRNDGTFTIVQFTDTHLHSFQKTDEATYYLMSMVIDVEQPDLIYLTGDIVKRTQRETWLEMISFLDDKAIPWAYVHGNHDPETHGHKVIEELLSQSRYCLYDSGPDDVEGFGNYVLPVFSKNGEIEALLWGFDSGMESDEPSGYDWIRNSQINWFLSEFQLLNQENINKIKNIAFFHIPLMQYETVWETQTCSGNKNENVCYQGKDIGQFEAFKDKISACFVGHDHVNDYSGNLDGIDLVYGRATGFSGYGLNGFMRGARIIVLHQGNPGYESYIRLEDGSIAKQPIHSP